jgi:hypothetical protein
MVDKIRVYTEHCKDYYNDKNCIFHGRYYKARFINHLVYGIQLYKRW